MQTTLLADPALGYLSYTTPYMPGRPARRHCLPSITTCCRSAKEAQISVVGLQAMLGSLFHSGDTPNHRIPGQPPCDGGGPLHGISSTPMDSTFYKKMAVAHNASKSLASGLHFTTSRSTVPIASRVLRALRRIHTATRTAHGSDGYTDIRNEVGINRSWFRGSGSKRVSRNWSNMRLGPKAQSTYLAGLQLTCNHRIVLQTP
jgi:hypothetical protein